MTQEKPTPLPPSQYRYSFLDFCFVGRNEEGVDLWTEEQMTEYGRAGAASRQAEIDVLKAELQAARAEIDALRVVQSSAFDPVAALRLADDYAFAQSQLDGKRSTSRKYYVEGRDEARAALTAYLGIKEAK